MRKKCFKCGEEKSLNDFYAHPMMADGHLGKCKTCAKRDVEERIRVKKTDIKWLMLERERCRKKQEKYRSLGLDYKSSQEVARRWRIKNKHKRSAHSKANRAIRLGKIIKPSACENCGDEGVKLDKHHHDYERPLSVIFLCKKCHMYLHRKTTLT